MGLIDMRPEEKYADMGGLDDRDRSDRIRSAYDAYYNGGPDTLKRRPGEINDNVKINYARLVVDAGVANLFGPSLTVGAPAGSVDSMQEDIDRLIRHNGGGLLWQRMGVSGAIGGTMFYRLMIHEGDHVRIVIVDPSTVDIEWDESDHEMVHGYTITFIPNAGPQSRARRHVITRDGEGWVTIEQESVESGWVTLSREPWPYPFPPMGHAQNIPSPHEVYGISDLEPDVLHLCNGINRVVSNINRIVRLYAHPRTFGKMIGDALNMDANPGAVIRLEHPDADLKNLEMSSDLGSSIALYKEMVCALHETTRIPEVATGKLDSAGQLSSLALRILYAPLLQKTESKRRTYGQAIEEMFRRSLCIMGYEDESLVELLWADILPSDPEMMRRTALIDMQLGVSQATLLEGLGYDPETEAEKMREQNINQQGNFNAGL